jgi:hypothetical protein
MRTVPARCRTPFSQHAAVVWRACRRCGVQGLDDVSNAVKGTPLQGGSIVLLPTPGRHGPDHPPRPGLATRGGDEAQGARGEPLQDWPDALRRRTWPWHLLTLRRQTRRTEALAQLVERGCRPAPDGLVPNVPKGHVPAQAQRVARSGAQDVVSPPRAVRRIARSEGARVTSHDRSHRPERREDATVPGDTVMGRMGPHPVPKGCQRLRYEGGQAPKTWAKVKEVLHAARAKVEEVGKGAVQLRARLTSRQRSAPRYGARSLPVSPRSAREGAVGHLAPDRRGD